LDNPVSNCSIPYSDIKPFILKYILKRWQDSWNQQIHMNLIFSEEATNFKARSIALASALKIELADGIRVE
jgi:hypothetical protein